MKQCNAELYVGMDVSEKKIKIYALSGDAENGESWDINNHAPSVNRFFERNFGDLKSITVALETGTHCNWLSDLLRAKGIKTHVANARKLRMISANHQKSDQRDAEMLARLVRADVRLLSPVRTKTPDVRRDLAVLKARDAMVRARTLLINNVRGILRSMGIKLSGLTPDNFGLKAFKFLPPELTMALNEPVVQIQHMTKAIQALDRQVERLCAKRPETKAVRQIKGVGPLTALAFVLVVGDPARFKDARRLGAYLGLTPKRDQSGDSDKPLSISKAGDKLLRRLLVEAAAYVLGPFGAPCALRVFGERIATRGGKIARRKARVAVARKLAIVMLSLWKSGEVYIPEGKKRAKKKTAMAA